MNPDRMIVLHDAEDGDEFALCAKDIKRAIQYRDVDKDPPVLWTEVAYSALDDQESTLDVRETPSQIAAMVNGEGA